ncbi:hypothetical protein LCGC14_0653900 [marine sediment metagenome]|uniref:Uncharacterized protein n=1 Tax=marine sediment metagenome TaxID=412755 RepID=A0A0F9QVL5_9ZZZZ
MTPSGKKLAKMLARVNAPRLKDWKAIVEGHIERCSGSLLFALRNHRE